MCPERSADKTCLIWRDGHAAASTARQALIAAVFGVDSGTIIRDPRPAWWPSAAFTPEGLCVATIEAAILTLRHAGGTTRVGAIRLVAVDPDWRGRGLSNDLVRRALAHFESEGVATVLLYAESPALYEKHGFRPLAQHAFEGPAPASFGEAAARRLDLKTDPALVAARLATRAPLSDVCCLLDAPDLFRARLASDDGLEIVDLPRLETLVVLERDGGTITLVDVVGAVIPSLAAILGRLGASPDRVRTLFSPDRLAWSGVPVLDETGLMVRGPLPATLQRPFMLPPTSEF